MADTLLVVRVEDRHPKYYNGMLDGEPRFGPKLKAVRLSPEMAETVARQLQQGWKIECWAMDGLVRFGAKPGVAA